MASFTSADNFEPTVEIESSNVAKNKPVWKKPTNGDFETGPVMGAELWPALSVSTRASPKPSLFDNSKTGPDGSLDLSMGDGNGSSSGHNLEVVNNAHPSCAPPTRLVYVKRGGGSSSSNDTASGGSSQPPPSPHSAAQEVRASAAKVVRSGSTLPVLSPRAKEGEKRGIGSHSRSGNDRIQKSDTFNRGNGGPHRVDGSHHRNSGGRGNQERGNNEWNSQQSFDGGDSHLQPQQSSPRDFLPQTHAPTNLFINPPPIIMRPYPVVYSDVPPPMFLYAAAPHDPFRGVPVVAPVAPPAMYYTVPDPQLIARIVHQINYYFSNENLVKDTYLRSNMDDQGWVPVQLIAGFKKMSSLTENIQLILEAVRGSNMVEVQGDKVRRREDWAKWILPTVQSPSFSSPHAQGSSNLETLIINAQNLSIAEKPMHRGEAGASSSRSSSGNFSQFRDF